MRRRALLATAASAGVAGCSLPALCARPPVRADRLEFQPRRADSSEWTLGRNDAVLATAPEHVERFEPPDDSAVDVRLPTADRTYLEETDFGEEFLVGVVVGSSGDSSEPNVTHVVRESDTDRGNGNDRGRGSESERVHVYVCIRRRGMTDDWAPYPRLVRVRNPDPDSFTPSGVRVTLTDGRDGTETFDTEAGGADWPEASKGMD